MPDQVGEIVIVGPGRAGLALAAALLRVGAASRIHLRGRRKALSDNDLAPFVGLPLSYSAGLKLPDGGAVAGVILAVPDGAIPAVAEALVEQAGRLLPPVLHLSGAAGREALQPVAEAGGAVGSLHPLVSLTGPDSADRLQGAWFAIEGEGAAERFAARLVEALGGRILPVAAARKALYHAAGVAASNFVVALLGEAEAWMVRAGVPAEAARAALTELAAGAVDNVARLGAAAALTGPIARGDAATVARHLAELSPPERRLYSVLAAAALDLARERGLAEAAVHDLESLIGSAE